jgi:hypothetical protein
MPPPLTPEQIKLEQERLKLIQEQNEAAKELTSQYEKQKKTTGFLTSEEKEILNISKQLYKVTNDIDKSISTRLSGTASVKDLTKQLNSLTLNQLGSNNELNKLQTEFAKKLDLSHQLKKKGLDLSVKQKATEEALGQKASRVANLQNSIRTYQTQILDAQRRGDSNEIQRLNNLKRRTSLLLSTAKQQEKDHKEDLKNINNEVASNKKKYDVIKSQANALQENKKIYESTIEEQKKEQELLKQAIIQKKKENALDALKKQFRVDELKEMFTLAGILNIIKNAALRFNAISVETGKHLGTSAKESDKITQNLVNIANSSDNLNITLKNVAEAMTELNDTTGGVAIYSADALETQVMLTKQFGLTGGEAANMYKFSVLTGKSSSQVNKEMVAAFANTRNAVKGSADFKKTIAEAVKVSGQLAANFRNNPAAITAAVVQMQALGTTLEQTKKQGDSLLDFESSLESELKAELLTGKQLNLERARAAALAGDQVTLAEELRKNAGSLEDFQKMNVLAQKSLAEAMGMTTDELATQLSQQKIAQEQGKSLAQIQAEDLEKAQKRQNVQDKFNAAILKLQDFIGNLVAGPVAQLLEMLSGALNLVFKILYPFQLIFQFATFIGSTLGGWLNKLGIFGTVLKYIAGLTVIMAGFAVTDAVARGLGTTGIGGLLAPVLAPAAGLAVAATGLSMITSVGDMISPANGKTQVSTKEGGLFELSPNDDLLAGPGLASGGISGGSMSIDLTPMVNAITEVRDAVNKLYSKEGIVNIDGKKVGTLLTQGSYKTA